ncbi:MAG: thioredoxin domain-containing protein [Promethearchaeota archaeon]
MLKGLSKSKNNDEDPNLEIIFFTSPTCGPCHIIEKDLVETVEKGKLPIKITRIDVTKNPEIAEQHDIIACPTLVFRDFMKIYGVCRRDELEELVSSYFAKIFEF